MCGIVGYVGPRRPLDVLIPGLRRLEYRGYDSAGIGVLEGGRIRVVKRQGPLARLEEALAREGADGPGGGRPARTAAAPGAGTGAAAPAGTAGATATVSIGSVQTGLGHTRWATHGRPSDENAHPHTDEARTIALVHNGIIENEAALRRELAERGHRFASETDTELVPHLIEEFYAPGGPAAGNLAEAVRMAMARLRGAFAFVVVSAREPGRMVVVRQSSPLVIGLGEGENFVASDIPALLPYTRRMVALSDGEMADIRPDEVVVTDLEGRPIERAPFTVDWDVAQAERGGYPHFMLKEIHEQPDAWRQTLAGRVDGEGRVDLAGGADAGVGAPESVTAERAALRDVLAREYQRVAVVACGSAYHAGLVGKTLLERWARIPVEVDVASEFRYREPLVGPDTLTVVISQSGETIDTLAAMREARERGSKALAIVNVVGSIIAREADAVLYTRAGLEISVCSTKAYTTQILAMALLALQLGRQRGTMQEAEWRAAGRELLRLPERARAALLTEPRVAEVAKRLATCEDVFFIGRGLDHAAAMEAQLKLKEISYIHAEAYAAGELKHGTLALVTDGVPVVAIATQPPLMDKVTSNIREVQARGAWVIALATEAEGLVGGAPATAGRAGAAGRPAGDWVPTVQALPAGVDDIITVPATHPYLQPALTAIPLQLLAYHAAVRRGSPVDKPRNLAKSVTVE